MNGFADDYTANVVDESLESMKAKLEIDSTNILTFMATNLLIANSSKTTFMIFSKSGRKLEQGQTIQVGSSKIKELDEQKLLGMYITPDLKWTMHITHLVEKLRHRLYLLRHISYLIPRSALKLVADGIVTTHIQYGLSLFGRFKLSETDPSCKEISILQVLHNQMVRIIYQLNIKDKVNMKTVRANNNIPSVNQLTGQAIAMVLRKAQLHDTLPLAYDLILENNVPDHRTRSCSQGLLRPPRHRLHSTSSSFPSQASSIWNKLPEYIRISTTDASFKKHLRKWLRSNIP